MASQASFGHRPFSDEDRARISATLRKAVGPEYLSQRAGPGGTKLVYICGNQVLSLANEVFGFDGWSHSIVSSEIDFVDTSQDGSLVSLGVSTVVRVTLRDGTSHEDIGYGRIENARSKGTAFEKVKKESVTDAIKRALRSFGEVMGNCTYNNELMQKIIKLKKKAAISVDMNELYHGQNCDAHSSKPTNPNSHNPGQANGNHTLHTNNAPAFDDDGDDGTIFCGDLEALDPAYLTVGMQNSSSTNTMTGNNPLNPGNTPRQHQPNMLVQSPAKTNAMASMTGVIRPPPINRVPTPVLQQQQRNGPPTPLQQPQQQQQHFGSTIGRTGISQQQPQSYNNAGQQSPHNQPGGQSGPIPQGQPTFNMGNATNIPPSTSNANNNKANANALIAKPFPLNSNNNTANVPMVSGSSSAVVGAAAKPGQQQQNQNNIILNNQGGVRPPQPVGGNRIQLPPPSGQNQQPPQPQHQQQYQQQYQSNGGAAFAGSTGNAYKRPLSSADSVNSNKLIIGQSSSNHTGGGNIVGTGGNSGHNNLNGVPPGAANRNGAVVAGIGSEAGGVGGGGANTGGGGGGGAGYQYANSNVKKQKI